MCSLIQLCPHQTVTCSKCLQMFSSCVRDYHYDFVVNDTWMVSFKNSWGPLPLQLWGWSRTQAQCSQPALPVVAMQNKSSSHTGWAGCGNPITAWALAAFAAKDISKLCLGRKRGHQITCFQAAYASTLRQPVLWGTWRYILQGHNTVWKLLKNKEINMPIFCWQKQEYGSKVSCRRGDR